MTQFHSTVKIPVPLADNGQPLQGFVWGQYIRGAKVEFGSEIVTLKGYDPKNQPAFEDLVAIVQGGGYFDNIKLAIEFATAAVAQTAVPLGVRNSTYVNESEVTVTRSWLEWLQVNTSNEVIQHTSGKPYVIKSSFNGAFLNSEELVLIHNQPGLKVIEWADAYARFNSEDYKVFEL